MTDEAAVSSGHKTLSKLNFLRLFCRFVEPSDWDEVILAQEELIDSLCIGVIIAVSLYLIPPVLVTVLLR